MNSNTERPKPGERREHDFEPREIRLPGRCGWCIDKIAHIHPAFWLALTAVVLAVGLPLVPKTAWDVLVKSLRAQKFLMTLLAAFSLLAISMIWTVGQRVDVWFFMIFNKRGSRPRWLDWVMLAFTQLGNGVFAYSLALIFLLQGRRMLAYEIIFGNLTLWLMVELMKVLIRRKRPYSSLHGIRVVGRRAGGHSFPSGHTSQSFFMASLLAHYLQAGFCVSLLFYVIALLIGITRIYVGMHYPRDVLGGAVLGTAWGLVGVVLNSYIFTQLAVIH